MPRAKPKPTKLSPEARAELAAYQRDYQLRRRKKLQSDTPVKDNLLIRQLHEKVTALFHKIHNLQIECQTALVESRRTNDLLLRILERPEDRVDAAAELAREREQRIEKFT